MQLVTPVEEFVPETVEPIKRWKSFHPQPTDTDWYGNIALHHAVAYDQPDIGKMRELLRTHKDGARTRNQFGRIPLHYAVDRCSPCVEAIRLLLEAYPEGAAEESNHHVTPYDIALHWNHSPRILRMMLSACPHIDRGRLLRLRYGPLARILCRRTHDLYIPHPYLDEHQNVYPDSPPNNALCFAWQSDNQLNGSSLSAGGGCMSSEESITAVNSHSHKEDEEVIVGAIHRHASKEESEVENIDHSSSGEANNNNMTAVALSITRCDTIQQPEEEHSSMIKSSPSSMLIERQEYLPFPGAPVTFEDDSSSFLASL